MRHDRYMLPFAVIAALMAFALPAAAQRTVTVQAGPQYDADGIVRVLAGSNWRDLWTTPVEVPVLDLDEYGGGLTPERTGGRQSRTLHFQGGDGRLYIFRSVNKFLHEQALPVALRRTVVGDVVQDQISTLMPAAGLLVGPLYEAVGLLHPWPTLVVMPDDPRLGEFREEYAGMVGQFEENPQEGPDDTPGFAGSSKLVGVDKMLERLDEKTEHRVDVAEYLAARLIQFMIGDTDRGGDQWRYADFPDPVRDGSRWRPVARDHDFAFMRPTGLVGWLSTAAYPKLSDFDGTFEDLRTLTFMTRDIDRRLLVELPRERWDSVVMALQTQLTDDVLRASAERLPVEWQPFAAERVFDGLRARRERLPGVAADFFEMVSREADVHATAEGEYAQVERLADGSVEVRLYPEDAVTAAVVADASARPGPPLTAPSASAMRSAPYFQRRFMPGETREIRLYMHGGDDHVHVTGSAQNSIRVRVIAGGGDDTLVDASEVSSGGWATRFYTAHGDDDVQRGPKTSVDDREYAEQLPGRPLDMVAFAPDPDEVEDESDDEDEEEDTPVEEVGIDEDVSERLLKPSYRDWGHVSGFGPTADFRSGAGLLIGVSRNYTRYGFRRHDYMYRLNATALYSIHTGGFGLETFADYRPENTRLGMSVEADATQFDMFRFYGFGNGTEVADGISPRVYRDQVTVRPSVYWADEQTYFGIGPIFHYSDPDYDEGSPLDALQPVGSGAFAQAGANAALRIERGVTGGSDPRGFSLDAWSAAYPALLDASEAFGRTRAVARAFVPLGWPFLALRAGGEHVWGGFPVHESAFLGGRNSLRGFETDRFAGDASLFGSTELHAPLGTIELLVRGEAGVFGLVDAGRVYFDGESPGGWHTSYGGGAWFYTLGNTLSITYATGEVGRLYLRLGMPL